MKKVYFLLLSLLFIAAISKNSDWNTVLLKSTNSTIKSKLKTFETQGIEKKVSNSAYSIAEVIETAKSFLGTPHVMGGTSKKGIDCSGLVQKAHQSVNISLPHSSHEQARFGKVIPLQENLLPGDMVFFYNSYNSKNLITHSGIYLGDTQFIHTSSKRGVEITSLNSTYWQERFLFGTRMHD